MGMEKKHVEGKRRNECRKRPCHERSMPWFYKEYSKRSIFFFNPTNMKMCQVWAIKILLGGCLFITESCKLLVSPHQSSVSVILAYYPRPSCVLTLFPEINSPLLSILPAKQTQVAECTRSLCSYICSSKDWPTKGKARVEIPSLDLRRSAQK